MSLNLNQKICIIHTDNGCGWHFFDWSIHYLGGNTEYFLFNDKKQIPVISNPIGGSNAHGHRVNFIVTPEEMSEYNALIDNSTHPTVIQACSKIPPVKSFAAKDDIVSEQIMSDLKKEHQDFYVKLINTAEELGFTPVTIHWSKKHLLIPVYQPRQAYDFYTGEIIPLENLHDSWQNTFFKKSEANFEKNIWDERERLALNLRIPFDKTLSERLVDLCPELQSFSTEDIWFNLDKVLQCDNYELLSKWKLIYADWQKIHDTKLSEDYWIILDAIVEGRDLDLSPYNLNFVKEALIQHGLIYRHNLNIKTWQLETFPDSTLELHKLLESNFHYRDPRYCELWPN